MRFLFLAALAAFFMAAPAKAQKHTLRGYVTEADGGEAVIGASVYVPGSGIGAATNIYGFFSFDLSDTARWVKVSSIGYETQTLPLAGGDSLLRIRLEKAGKELREVEITAGAEPEGGWEVLGTQSLQVARLKQIPLILGETDIIKALQLLPGVQGGREGASDFQVRGGASDQNLILLDGAPVYNVNHFLGFFSTFNADAIKKVDLVKGGFPARYGGRLSSVMDIQLKEGNNQKFSGEGNIGLLASKILLEGPIVKNKSSFLVSARRTYADLVISPLVKLSGDGKAAGGYYFYDLNAKLNYTLSDKDKIYWSVYAGRDNFYKSNKSYNSYENVDQTEKFNIDWGNISSALRWNHLFSKKMFGNATLFMSRYGFGVNNFASEKSRGGAYSGEMDLRYGSSIKDAGIKMDFDWFAHPSNTLKFGFSGTRHLFSPTYLSALYKTDGKTETDTAYGIQPIAALDGYLFAEDEISLGKRLKANIGLHASGFYADETFYRALQPRASLLLGVSPNGSLKAAYSRMTQYMHLLANSPTGMPTDIWVPSTAKVKPQQASQASLGYIWAGTLAGADWAFSAEAYYKAMRRMAAFKSGINFLENGPETNYMNAALVQWDSNVLSGKGESYGAEFFAEKKTGPFNGWVSYTLAWSFRQFDGLNRGKPFHEQYDRRHNVAVVMNKKLSDRWQANLNWVYSSGAWITAPQLQYKHYSDQDDFGKQPGEGGQVQQNDPRLDYFTEPNNFRTRAYHRLDLGFSNEKQKKRGIRTWNFGLYNVYARRNPFYTYIQPPRPGTGDNKVKLGQSSLFPALPMVSYSFKF